MPKASSFFYAVRVGRRPGIYRSWDECKAATQGFPGAVFKKFRLEPEAKAFVANKPNALLAARASPAVAASSRTEPYARTVSRKRPHHHKTPSQLPLPTPLAGETADFITVYTDGASSRNGQEGARAGIGVYFGAGDPRNVSEPLSSLSDDGRQTNQRAELMAILRAIEAAENSKKKLLICTDSMYSINCLTVWFRKWERNGWTSSVSRKPVENQDIIKPILDRIRARGGNVCFRHVRGHVGIAGNEAADRLAVAGSLM
ncbi:hypothetical protein IWW36_003189 [Coemansia brasiliensis]|uniref:Ribonuclease H n=1 Tax=Coemansia brasiliensis TaxID=2650707 RepID=A0A9W8LXF9_9FUNG|nr:hypothetical protein IWW36_003189 [Coemansia brasiliensis]